MQSLAHADIFFLITTVAVGVLTVGLVIAIVWLVKLLRLLHKIITVVRTELTAVNDYLDTQMKTSQSKLSAFVLVAEGLMRLYGSFTNSKNSKRKGISSKRK